MKSNKANIKIGYLISYDYKYIFNSLKLTYDDADLIVLCYDKNFKTWAGNAFEIPNSFFETIKELDVNNKIRFYEDAFYLPEHAETAMFLETRQRNMLAKFMGKGGWHIQLDVDEYPYKFVEIVTFLKSIKQLLKDPTRNPINIIAKWIVLFKNDECGYYVINPIKEDFYLATNAPNYTKARQTNADCILTDFYVVHQSWARTQKEINQKINNWSHKSDFDSAKYLQIWESCSEFNYDKIKNFHPVNPSEWESLEFIPSKNIEDCIEKLSSLYPQPSSLQQINKLNVKSRPSALTKYKNKVIQFFR